MKRTKITAAKRRMKIARGSQHLDLEKLHAVQENADALAEARGLRRGWAHDYLPKQDPKGWRRLVTREDGMQWLTGHGVGIIASCTIEEDGHLWMHISVSRDGGMRLPTWRDLVYARDCLVGSDQEAVQYIPPATNHVNQMQVLHIWIKLDGELGLPDFTKGTGTI